MIGETLNRASERPKVAISSCLIGEKVRYDGADKAIDQWQQRLATSLELIAICPEVRAGLGVPRAPVQLVATDNQVKALGRDDPSIDVTARLQRVAIESSRELVSSGISGYIFKSRSPSCGLRSTPLHNDAGQPIALTSGLQAQEVTHTLVHLASCEESALQSQADINQFVFLCRLVHDGQISIRNGTLNSFVSHYRKLAAIPVAVDHTLSPWQVIAEVRRWFEVSKENS